MGGGESYFGLTLEKSMSFKTSIKDLVLRTKIAYAALHSKINIYEGANPMTVIKLFDRMVITILL